MSDPRGTGARRTGWAMTGIVVALAFVAGIGATALFLNHYRRWLSPEAQQMIAPALPSAPGFVPPPEVRAVPPPDAEALAARQAALAAELATLEARAGLIDRESQGAAAQAGRAEALLLAFAARRAIDRGLGLGSLEAPLRAHFAGQPAAVIAVIRSARAPVTVEDLRAGLDGIATDLSSGVRRDGWWSALRREVGNLVVLHREGLPSPRPTERLTRARRLLEAGQVEAALAEVALMPGAASATAWTEAARRYVAAHKALDTLEAAALATPVAVPGSAPAAGAATAPIAGAGAATPPDARAEPRQ